MHMRLAATIVARTARVVSPYRFASSLTSTTDTLKQAGYAVFGADTLSNGSQQNNLTLIQQTYTDLTYDPNPGNRYRAHSRYDWDVSEQRFVLQADNDYFQTKQANNADGGKVRKFSAIAPTFLNNPVIQQLLLVDTKIAKTVEEVEFDEELSMGLHQIRYQASEQSPSFSSPLWLHKDDEPLVFVHLFGRSQNVIGGDNLIAQRPRAINDVLTLEEPLDTVALRKSVFHAVTPLGTKDAKPAYRDVLLVTFFNRQQQKGGYGASREQEDRPEQNLRLVK